MAGADRAGLPDRPRARWRNRLACAGCMLLCAGPAAAQDAEPAPPSGRKPTKEEVASRLDAVKQDLLPKVWSEKVAADKLERKKYLAAWQAVTSEHYIVFTDGPTASCRKYAVTLEDNYRTIQKQLPFADLDRLLVAYIFDKQEDYYRFCVAISGYTEQGARATAGHATGAYYATYYQSPRAATVFHEATHQVVHACLRVPGVGSWFQEGIAVYFEKLAVNEKPQGDAGPDIKRGHWYRLAEFFAIATLLSDPQGNGHRNYEHAGALLDFMINTKLPPVAGRFADFLAAARKGRGFRRGKEASEKLITDVYGLSLAEFEALWLQHLGVKD
jgi:hypothetical protein